MDIPAAMPGKRKDVCRQDQAICNNDHQVCVQPRYEIGGSFISERLRLVNFNAMIKCFLFYRACLQFSATPRRPVRLAQYGDRTQTFINQPLQGRYGEIRRAGKQDSQVTMATLCVQSRAFAGYCPETFRCFSRFFVTKRRFIGER